MKRKPLQGWKHRWEPQAEETTGSIPMPGTSLVRGQRIQDCGGGTVLGTSDNGEWIGVLFDGAEFVTEYTLEQFSSRFGREYPPQIARIV